MAFTTIPSSGLPGNRHSGVISGRWPGDSSCPEVVVSAASESSGAYRFGPSGHESGVPDSDPRSPRYEPPHLRHRPGDTWVIDRERPYDPLDPGPFGSPGWYPDERTGRHRRGELPDDAEHEAPQAGGSLGGAEARPTRPPVKAAREPRRLGRADGEPQAVRPSPGASEEPDPIRPVFRPSPERRSVPPGFSADPFPEEDESEEPDPPRRYRWQGSASQEEHDFGKLREDAWIGFLEGSQPFHDAHFDRSIGRSVSVSGSSLRSGGWSSCCSGSSGSLGVRSARSSRNRVRRWCRAGLSRSPTGFPVGLGRNLRLCRAEGSSETQGRARIGPRPSAPSSWIGSDISMRPKPSERR